jgi:hypothetical protein
MQYYSKVKDAPMSLPLLYRTFALVRANEPKIRKEPAISRYHVTNGRGKLIRNSRAYRRAGGDATPTERMLQDWEIAWLLVFNRAEEMYKYLYKLGLKEAANPLFAYEKAYKTKGLKIAVSAFFKNKTYPSTYTKTLSYMLTKKSGKQIEVSPLGEVTVDGQTSSFRVLFDNDTHQEFNGLWADFQSKT